MWLFQLKQKEIGSEILKTKWTVGKPVSSECFVIKSFYYKYL